MSETVLAPDPRKMETDDAWIPEVWVIQESCGDGCCLSSQTLRQNPEMEPVDAVFQVHLKDVTGWFESLDAALRHHEGRSWLPEITRDQVQCMHSPRIRAEEEAGDGQCNYRGAIVSHRGRTQLFVYQRLGKHKISTGSVRSA